MDEKLKNWSICNDCKNDINNWCVKYSKKIDLALKDCGYGNNKDKYGE